MNARKDPGDNTQVTTLDWPPGVEAACGKYCEERSMRMGKEKLI